MCICTVMGALWLKSFLKDCWKYNINSYRSFSSSLSLSLSIPIPYFLSISVYSVFRFLTLHFSLCFLLSLTHTHSHLFLSIQDLMVNYFKLNGVSNFPERLGTIFASLCREVCALNIRVAHPCVLVRFRIRSWYRDLRFPLNRSFLEVFIYVIVK